MDSAGKPIPSKWDLESNADLDSVAAWEEVLQSADGELHGPKVVVGEQEHEVLQIALPFFDEVEAGMLPAVSKACVLQTPVKAMLWERKVAEQLSCQGGVESSGAARSKILSKALRGKAQALALQTWRKEMQVKISKHGVSRSEALAALEPAVGKMCADLGLLAVKRFLQGQRDLVAIKVNEHHPFCSP